MDRFNRWAIQPIEYIKGHSFLNKAATLFSFPYIALQLSVPIATRYFREILFVSKYYLIAFTIFSPVYEINYSSVKNSVFNLFS